MNDLFSLFGNEESEPVKGPRAMSPAQPQVLRELFKQIGLTTAREQFDLVEELTSQRIRWVSDLDERAAAGLIIRLRHRATSVA